MNLKQDIFKYIAIIYILFYIFILIYKGSKLGIDHVFWYCYWILLLVGISLLLDNRKLLSVFFVQTIILQSPWIIDVLYLVFFEGPFLGTANYMFTGYHGLVDFIISLVHYLMIPILFIYFTQNKFYIKKSYHIIVNIIMFVLLIGSSVLFTAPVNNINCSSMPCVVLLPHFNGQILHLITYFILVQTVMLGVFYVLNFVFNKLKLNDKLKKRVSLIIVNVFVVLMILTIIKYFLVMYL